MHTGFWKKCIYLLLIEISKKSVHDSDDIKNRSPTLPLLVSPWVSQLQLLNFFTYTTGEKG